MRFPYVIFLLWFMGLFLNLLKTGLIIIILILIVKQLNKKN